jgi:hypothetical protein
MVQFREHRGGLAESMATVREVRDREHLVRLVAEALEPWGLAITPDMVSLERIGFDPRIGWDTWMVTVEGYGVFGMTDGPL